MKVRKNIPWDLIISYLKEETSLQDEQALQEWRRKGDNNELYIELASLWKEVQKETGTYIPNADYYWKKLEERISEREEIKERKENFAIPLKRFRKIVAVASVLIAVSVSISFFLGKSSLNHAVSTQTYTALNGKSLMTLPDGTSVWLNIGTTLTYKTSFTKERTVELEGEALFDVITNTESPFVVEMNNVSVKVLGTRFNIQAYPEKPDIRVALLEGRVSVLTNDTEAIMNSGEIAYFSKESHSLSIQPNDVMFESSWANKSYTFTAKNLSYISKYLEKWYNVSITLDPTVAESYAYTFTITDEPLETILQIMSRINPITYTFEENNKVIIEYVK